MLEMVEGFMFSPDGSQVVLIKKKRPAHLMNLWNGVGGKVEPKEEPVDAMVREFREETGVETVITDWRAYARITGNMISAHGGWAVTLYTTRSTKFSEVKTATDEEVAIYGMTSLPPTLVSNLSWLIPMAMDSKVKFSHTDVS